MAHLIETVSVAIFVLSVTITVKGFTPCSCASSVLDCSNRNRHALLNSELKCSGQTWNLQGNKFRDFFYKGKTPIKLLQLSENELGMGNFTLSLDSSYDVINITKNNLTSLNFLSSCSYTISNLILSDNSIADFSAIFNCYKVTILNMRNNEIPYISWTNITTKVYTYEIDLSNNPIEYISLNAFDFFSGLKIIYLSNEKLQTFEAHTFQSYLTDLILNDNQLNNLSEDSFNDVLRYSLNNLQLNGNRLTHLPENIFEEMQLLKNLYLNDNLLMELPGNIFEDLYMLENLYLNGNLLEKLPGDIFANLESLKTLCLNGNMLQELQDNIFNKNLTKLVSLHLYDNQLTKLEKDSLRGLSGLPALSLQSNKLQSLPDDVFDDLRSLTLLDLDDNLLEELPARLFSRLHSLEELSVRSNRLTTIPSLQECGAPLNISVFHSNAITTLDETPLRAFLHHGNRFADLSYNPIRRDSAKWILEGSDLIVTGTTRSECAIVSLEGFTNRGTVQFCFAD